MRACAGTVAAALVAASVLAGCGGGGRSQSQRAQRLLVLAGDETAAITEPAERFRRQVNLADMQIDWRHGRDAAATLDHARQTLEAVTDDQMDEYTQLAGWVSLSELNRRAESTAAARYALAKALDRLRRVEPAGRRCEYVLAVAQEVYSLEGRSQATALLRESGQWALQLDSQQTRRDNLRAIASNLFHYDDYDGGRDVLRLDEQPQWRADTLLGLARQARPILFGKQLNYAASFQQSL